MQLPNAHKIVCSGKNRALRNTSRQRAVGKIPSRKPRSSKSAHLRNQLDSLAALFIQSMTSLTRGTESLPAICVTVITVAAAEQKDDCWRAVAILADRLLAVDAKGFGDVHFIPLGLRRTVQRR